MNQRKARAIRKIVYGGAKPESKYIRVKSTKGKPSPILNVGDIEKVTDSTTGNSRQIPKRRIYRYLKKISKGIPIKNLEKVFLNEKKIQ